MKQRKIVLITGASSGFGKACAELLAKKGYRLILLARRDELLKKLKKQLKTDVHIAAVDVRNKKEVTTFFKALPKAYQDIDLHGTNIKVTNIEPGAAETEFSIVRFKGDLEKAKKVYQDTRALTAQDIANTIYWVISQPPHVNIDNIEIMPVDQTFGGMAINRKNTH